MKGQNRNLSGARINKYLIIFLFVFFLFSIGASYAYFSYQTENTVAIKGNIVSIDAELTVERVVGTNEDMVPMLDGALSNAINAVGTTNGACVDSQGNLSCQVYKITLTNNGSRLKNLQGTVELYAKSGGTYTNLKWQELTNTTTIKEGTSPKGMAKSTLVSNLTIQSKETLTWYIAVWISEIDSDQRNTDKGQFGGTVEFGVSNGESLHSTITKDAVADNIASEHVSSSSGINFGAISSDTNGKGIYMLNITSNDTNPIYYYRGAVDNNNIIFADFCWKIVRTTETGGVKLIYNGTPTNGTCNNTGTSSQIGTSAFNTNNNDNAYVGYMYGTTGATTYEDTHENTNDSTIKTAIDTWYENNMTTYTSKLEDTIWCNDRSISSGPGVGDDEVTEYMAAERLNNYSPSLVCSQDNDKFTVDTANGNGDLDYPVGLITADEIAYAGGLLNTTNYSYYLSTGMDYWTVTPNSSSGYGELFYVWGAGDLDYTDVDTELGVRPSVSLKPGTTIISGGTGTVDNPYVVN